MASRTVFSRLRRRVLTAVVLLAAGAPLAARDGAAERAELARTQREIARLARHIERQHAERDRARSALAQAERSALAAQRELERLDRALARHTDELRTLEARRRERERALAAARDALAEGLRAAYLARHEGGLKLLLGNDEPARAGRLLVYHRYLAQAHAQRLARLEEELSALAALRRQVRAQRDAAAALRAEQTTQRGRLEAAREARARHLAQVQQELGDSKARAQRARADAARLSALVAGIERSLRETPPPPVPSPAPVAASARPSFVQPVGRFAQQRGKLPWPVAGRLAARYGQARESGRTRWQGAFIAAAPGTAVRSVFPGRVVYADALRGFGLLVIVDHGGGYLSLYGYNGALKRQAGDLVAAGDVLAEVGDGLMQPTGAYFEIRRRGEPVDPATWCRS